VDNCAAPVDPHRQGLTTEVLLVWWWWLGRHMDGAGQDTGKQSLFCAIEELIATATPDRREALRTTRMRLRDVNWIGDEARADLAAAPREVYVKVRSTRPPQPAWLRLASDGAEVDLVDGEDGVSPGQACAFYDAEAGQARVLGGGFIASAAGAQRQPLEPTQAADVRG